MQPNATSCESVCTYAYDDADIEATDNCRMSGSVKMFTHIDIASQTETYIRSESVILSTDIDTAAPQDAVDHAFIKTPELQSCNTLFAQIDILHQQLINIWSPDTLVCEQILRNLTPTPGNEFRRTNIK